MIKMDKNLSEYRWGGSALTVVGPNSTFIYYQDTKFDIRGSGCGADDSTVASDSRGPGFESRHWQLLLNIFTVDCL